MTKVDDLVVEVIAAKEQLKNINTTINRDRWIITELENEIKDKENKLLSLNNELEAKEWEVESFNVMVEWISKEY